MICFSFQSYKPSTASRTVFCTMFFILLMAMTPSLSWAASVTIDEIDVDVSASNAVEAREKAFEEAQVKGYAKLAAKMLTEEELQTFEAPDIAVVSRYVQDFEVSNERLSATRYAGTYKIRYDASGFNQKSNQGAHASGAAITSAKGSILILPFFEDAGYPMLWSTNPFMQAWLRARDNGVLERNGQTEASMDLARLADLTPAAMICEVMNDDGTMARLPDLMEFAARHELGIVSVKALIEYRLATEKQNILRHAG